MRLSRILPFLAALGTVVIARAVTTNGSYVTTEPTVANWTTGWGASGVTGWDYVGQIGSASAVYLGNGWVITAAHVGAGNFTLDGVTYSYVAGTATTITNASGTADIVLFQIATAPTLPALTIRSTDPTVDSSVTSGSQVVMIGYGGGQGETWGANTVTGKNYNITPSGTTYVTTDFYSKYGTTTYGLRTVTNSALLGGGDSGGGAFIFNSSTGTWGLAGINEAVGTDNSGNKYSFLVQLNVYAAQINAIIAVAAVPESDWTSGAIAAAALFLVLGRSLRLRDRPSGTFFQKNVARAPGA